jgi:hypothetical protein
MSARPESTVMMVAFWSAASGYDVESVAIHVDPIAFRFDSKAEPSLREPAAPPGDSTPAEPQRTQRTQRLAGRDAEPSPIRDRSAISAKSLRALR